MMASCESETQHASCPQDNEKGKEHLLLQVPKGKGEGSSIQHRTSNKEATFQNKLLLFVYLKRIA